MKILYMPTTVIQKKRERFVIYFTKAYFQSNFRRLLLQGNNSIEKIGTWCEPKMYRKKKYQRFLNESLC